jgi:hypothetical protein
MLPPEETWKFRVEPFPPFWPPLLIEITAVGAWAVLSVTMILAVAVFERPALLVTFSVIVWDAAANGKVKLGRLLINPPLLRHS